MTKDGNTFTDYNLVWEVRNGIYSAKPVFEFNSGLSAGQYTIKFNNIKNSHNKTVSDELNFTVSAGDPLLGFKESTLIIDSQNKTINGFINGYPISAIEPEWNDGGNNSAVIKDYSGSVVDKGGIYGGYTYEVTNSAGITYEYTFCADGEIYSNDFNADFVLTDGTSEINKDNRGQRDKLFPAEDAVSSPIDVKPVDKSGNTVASWKQELFQNILISAEGLSITRKNVPFKTDKAVAMQAKEFSGKDSIQLLKDFYVGNDNYPIQISMSVMPDGKGDVSFGIKTSYYGEAWQAAEDGVSDGSGKNSLATPVKFCADGKLLSFGQEIGEYAPGNWYNVSLVLDKVIVGDNVSKTAQLYINGKTVGEPYDWSNISSTLGNEGFYSLTMREDYNTEEVINSASYFDNLQIGELYNQETQPNGYMFEVSSKDNACELISESGILKTAEKLSSEQLISKLTEVNQGITVSVVDAEGVASDRYELNGKYRIVYRRGDYVQSYTIMNSDTSQKDDFSVTLSQNGTEALMLAEGENTITVLNSVEDGICIAALYEDGSGVLKNIVSGSIENGRAELTFGVNEKCSAKVFAWNDLQAMKPLADFGIHSYSMK